MELKGIKEFLERYKTTLLKSDSTREDIILTIFEISGVKLKNSDFKLERHDIILLTSPIKKNQIFLHKGHILESLKRTTSETISDIH